MGRYRESTASKALKGTLRKSRELTAPPEFNPFTVAPPAPIDLPLYAQAVWNETAAGLCQYKVLTPLDLPLFKAWCYQVHMIETAQQKLDQEGYVIQSTNVKGHTNSYKSPWISILSEATTLANRVGAQFGLSPSFRQKLQMELPKKQGRLAQLMNPFSGFPKGYEPTAEDLEIYLNGPDHDPMDGILPD